MSDNRFNNDDKTRAFNLNDVDDKTRVFNLSDEKISSTREFSLNDNQVVNNGLSDDEKDFFTDQPLEDISGYAEKSYETKDKGYGDGFDENSPSEENPYESFADDALHSDYEENKSHEVRPSHSKPEKSKVPLIIGIVASILGAIAIIATVIICINGCSKNETTADTTTTTVTQTETTDEETTVTEETEEETTEEVTTLEETTEPTTEEETEETTISGNYISAEFGAYKCITPDGEVVSDDVSSAVGGYTGISLSDNGTFNLSVGTVASTSGNYVIDGNYISLGDYSGNISFDSDNNPIGIVVADVEGYTVYFN